MERLYCQTVDLEKIRIQMNHYSHELLMMLQQPESTEAERDILRSVYQRLQILHSAMAKDMIELEMLFTSSSQQPVSVQPRNNRKATVKTTTIRFSYKENEVLNMLTKGYSYCEIAALMDCKLSTIQTHIKRIYKKLRVHSRSEAIFEARQLGLVQV